MRRDVLLLLCSFYLLPLGAHADDSGLSAKDIKTLFFGHDDRKAVNRPEESPWDAIGQLETASGNLCTATLISPHLALTAGHCLLTPPRGKPDKAVALRFISRKGNWVYEIHGIDGRVDPSLGRRLKADGDGWIVPSAAAPSDFGLIVLRYAPSGITPIPLFPGSKADLTAALKAADRNPYSWNMEYYAYPDGSGYEARFTQCGICTLMKELGLYDLTPALCHLDYTMAEAGETADFVREYTLASGGPYCDCGYRRKTR